MTADKLLWAGKEALFSIREAERQAAFEERIVVAILRHWDIKTPLARLRAAAQEKYGYAALTFRWLYDVAPRFPFVMGAAKLPYTAGITLLEAMTTSLGKLPFFREYQAWLDSTGTDPDDVPTAFFFTLGSRIFVLRSVATDHDIDGDALAVSGGCLVRRCGTPPTYYAIEEASAFISRLPTDCYDGDC